MSNYIYEPMWEKQDALERLDLRIRWGDYEVRVMRFHLTSFPPGKVVGFHKHEEYEFHFIPRGKGKVIIEDQSFMLREGMLYLTGPGLMHYQEADQYEAMDELCLQVDIIKAGRDSLVRAADLDQWEQAEAHDCIDKLAHVPLHPVMDIYRAMPYFLEAYEACTDNIMGSYTTIKHDIVQILLRTARAYSNEPIYSDFPERDMKSYRYRLAMQYLRANYAGSVTLEDLSERLNISSRQLQRILKEQHPERSFSGILEDIRLSAVCDRLIQSDQPVEQIALAEGFSSGNYLHQVFKKRIGMTPSQYRNKHAAEG